MSCWALVALKAATAAKGRLAETLSVDERSRLVELMLDNVLAALREARSIEGIAVVTSESLACAGVTRIEDPGQGLNEALEHAARELIERGASELLVLHADLPLVSGVEIDELIACGRRSGLAIAPDKQGVGTNAVFVTLPTPFRFHFGVDSFSRHLAEAGKHGMAPQRIALPGLAFDVDEPGDLVRLLEEGGAEYGFLRAGQR